MSLTSCARHRFLASSFHRNYKEAGPSLKGSVLLMRLHHLLDLFHTTARASGRTDSDTDKVLSMKLPTSHRPKEKKRTRDQGQRSCHLPSREANRTERARRAPDANTQPNPLKASTGEVAVRVGCVRTSYGRRSRIRKVGRCIYWH